MRGRFAPSPTGDLHAGSLVAALAGWLQVRQAGGTWLLRVEDIDPPREVPGSATAIITELARLGMTPDEPPCYQSTRHAAYREALQALREAGHAFPCWCSRRDLEQAGGLHRDGCCVAPPDPHRAPAWRLRVPDRVITFEDALQGMQHQNLRQAIGDFVLYRADGVWAYQLACVVDDAAQGITDVVRGIDLLDSTPRQIHLQHLLGLPTPRYLHLPLVTDTSGRKLSKSAADRPLATREPAPLLRAALGRLGLERRALDATPPERLLAHALAHFDIRHLPRESLPAF